jgi:hypothetical protein
MACGRISNNILSKRPSGDLVINKRTNMEGGLGIQRQEVGDDLSKGDICSEGGGLKGRYILSGAQRANSASDRVVSQHSEIIV